MGTIGNISKYSRTNRINSFGVVKLNPGYNITIVTIFVWQKYVQYKSVITNKIWQLHGVCYSRLILYKFLPDKNCYNCNVMIIKVRKVRIDEEA